MNPIALVLLLALCAASPGEAQLVRGKITSSSTGAALIGALVTLEDSLGVARVRVVSSASGAYSLFAPGAGRWQLRVAAIGYDPSLSRAMILTTIGDAVIDVAMTVRPFQLPALVVHGKGARCFPDPVGESVVARLMDEAETALQLVDASIASKRLEFVTESWQSRALVGARDTLRGQQRSHTRASWPIASTDIDLLRTRGFVRDTGGAMPANGYAENSGPIYYGPDVAVLFAPWFRERHCFTLDQQAGGDSLVVRFTPKVVTKGTVDVEGALVIDRGTLALRRLVFGYVGLPGWVPKKGVSAGGEIGFRRLENGLWAADNWRMRAPIRLQRRWGSGSASFGGWAELGGQVVEMWETGTPGRRPLAGTPG